MQFSEGPNTPVPKRRRATSQTKPNYPTSEQTTNLSSTNSLQTMSTRPQMMGRATSQTQQTSGSLNATAPHQPSTSHQQKDEDDEKGSNVRVVVRVRPVSGLETATPNHSIAVNPISASEIRVQKRGGFPDKTFTYDQVFSTFTDQATIFNAAASPIIDEVLMGFNCTIFAYGQTGTGKTHTMEGSVSSDSTDKNAGIIPRCVHTIFSRLRTMCHGVEGAEFSVKVSFLEIYNEELVDLLSDDTTKQLRIYDDPTGKNSGMLVQGLDETIVDSPEQVFRMLQISQQRRRVAETNLNMHSSRSHYVFTITIHMKEISMDGEDVIKTGKLHLVDLAGSECIGRSGAQNQRAKEAGKINQSLLTLGRVINALVEKQGYIPYRDSKLTRLLQESLGGRSKTCIIATVTPSSLAVDESLSTLEYANRAKNIKNKPQVSTVFSKNQYIKENAKLIRELQAQVLALRTKNGNFLTPEEFAEFETNRLLVGEMEGAIKQKEKDIEQLEVLCSIRQSQAQSISRKHVLTSKELQIAKMDLVSAQLAGRELQDALKEEQWVGVVRAQAEAQLLKEAIHTHYVAQSALHDSNILYDKYVRSRLAAQAHDNDLNDFRGVYAADSTRLKGLLVAAENHITQEASHTTNSLNAYANASQTVWNDLEARLQRRTRTVVDSLDSISQTTVSVKQQVQAAGVEMKANIAKSSTEVQAMLLQSIEGPSGVIQSVNSLAQGESQRYEEILENSSNARHMVSNNMDQTQSLASEELQAIVAMIDSQNTMCDEMTQEVSSLIADGQQTTSKLQTKHTDATSESATRISDILRSTETFSNEITDTTQKNMEAIHAAAIKGANAGRAFASDWKKSSHLQTEKTVASLDELRTTLLETQTNISKHIKIAQETGKAVRESVALSVTLEQDETRAASLALSQHTSSVEGMLQHASTLVQATVQLASEKCQKIVDDILTFEKLSITTSDQETSSLLQEITNLVQKQKTAQQNRLRNQSLEFQNSLHETLSETKLLLAQIQEETIEKLRHDVSSFSETTLSHHNVLQKQRQERFKSGFEEPSENLSRSVLAAQADILSSLTNLTSQQSQHSSEQEMAGEIEKLEVHVKDCFDKDSKKIVQFTEAAANHLAASVGAPAKSFATSTKATSTQHIESAQASTTSLLQQLSDTNNTVTETCTALEQTTFPSITNTVATYGSSHQDSLESFHSKAVGMTDELISLTTNTTEMVNQYSGYIQSQGEQAASSLNQTASKVQLQSSTFANELRGSMSSIKDKTTQYNAAIVGIVSEEVENKILAKDCVIISSAAQQSLVDFQEMESSNASAWASAENSSCSALESIVTTVRDSTSGPTGSISMLNSLNTAFDAMIKDSTANQSVIAPIGGTPLRLRVKPQKLQFQTSLGSNNRDIDMTSHEISKLFQSSSSAPGEWSNSTSNIKQESSNETGSLRVREVVLPQSFSIPENEANLREKFREARAVGGFSTHIAEDHEATGSYHDLQVQSNHGDFCPADFNTSMDLENSFAVMASKIQETANDEANDVAFGGAFGAVPINPTAPAIVANPDIMASVRSATTIPSSKPTETLVSSLVEAALSGQPLTDEHLATLLLLSKPLYCPPKPLRVLPDEESFDPPVIVPSDFPLAVSQQMNQVNFKIPPGTTLSQGQGQRQRQSRNDMNFMNPAPHSIITSFESKQPPMSSPTHSIRIHSPKHDRSPRGFKSVNPSSPRARPEAGDGMEDERQFKCPATPQRTSSRSVGSLSNSHALSQDEFNDVSTGLRRPRTPVMSVNNTHSRPTSTSSTSSLHHAPSHSFASHRRTASTQEPIDEHFAQNINAMDDLAYSEQDNLDNQEYHDNEEEFQEAPLETADMLEESADSFRDINESEEEIHGASMPPTPVARLNNMQRSQPQQAQQSTFGVRNTGTSSQVHSRATTPKSTLLSSSNQNSMSMMNKNTNMNGRVPPSRMNPTSSGPTTSAMRSQKLPQAQPGMFSSQASSQSRQTLPQSQPQLSRGRSIPTGTTNENISPTNLASMSSLNRTKVMGSTVNPKALPNGGNPRTASSTTQSTTRNFGDKVAGRMNTMSTTKKL